MDIKEVFSQADTADVIKELKSKRYSEQPDIEKYKNLLNSGKHDVFDKLKRPDKKVKIDSEDDNVKKIITAEESDSGFRYEPVARIAVALQKLIVKRAVAFLFGRDVTLNAEVEKGSSEENVLKAVKAILNDNKGKSLNRKVAREAFSCTEVAEIWYPIQMEKTQTGSTMMARVKDFVSNLIGNKYHLKYGFKSAYKLRCSIFSPLLGDTLWPYFDETGDLVAFSREFSRSDGSNVTQKYFETYTDTEHYLWTLSNDGYQLVEGYPKQIAIGKIPIVYARQDQVEWADVQILIDRLEKLLSNFADTNDYHASPKIFTTGEIHGWAKKGESGAVIEGDEGADAKYLSWENAPESVKLEIETLLRLIYTITQTPDISFDSIKGIGAISGVALKLLFMDAHLKVADHQEVFDEYLQRRVNVIKAFVAQFSTALKEAVENIDIEPVITPYMINDEIAEITKWTTANGGKPIISQKLSATLAGLSQDPEADYEQMLQETDRENQFTFNEPTVV